MDLSFNSLDPADSPSPRAFVQYEQNRRKETDQRDAVQKKTFTKWVNKHLLKAGRRIIDLFEGFRDGHNLLSLLEVLSHESLPRERGRMKFHQIQNVQIALEFLRRKGIRLVNIRSDEIVEGNPKLTLGLVWTIILHFQISDVVVPGQPEDISAKEALLLWSRRTTDGYPGVHVRDFDHSWRDGKAFLSIIHRNRPDVIDFRKVQTQTNKQNLELAFSTAEREFGVTRLLDPEDVDVEKPDEKSIITYVSSLYDVFPDVPSVEQSLKDNERQLKIDEYKDLAVPLLSWLQEAIMLMSQRNFPTTLIEMKSLLADLNRFKIEDVPPRLEMRKRAYRLFEDIQSSGASHLGADDELYPDNISRLWNRFDHALQEKEMAIQAEIIRLERLQRLAEKLHRESKHAEDSLNDIDRRIREEERRADSLHPFEAKRNCDALERALKAIEDNVRSLLRDAQALQDGRYNNADNIYRRVSTLQSRVSGLRTELYSNVIQKLVSKSFVEEGVTTTKRREVVTEVRLVESNPAFRHIQHCLHWIEAKQKGIEAEEYGTDLGSIQMNCDTHQQDHMEVTGFKKEIDKCKNDRRNLLSDEQDLYTEWLSKAEVAYSLLHNTSSRRLKNLESLLEFIQAATQELIWLGEKEEVEVTRDWSSSRLNVPTVEEFYKNLLHEMKAREAQFNSLQDRGNSMVLDRHPASKTIEAYMGEMQSQWSWLLQLSVCLETHVKQASAYYQYFEEAAECEQWMSRQADSINIRYSEDNQSVETLQQLLKELQELSDHVSEYERRVSSLTIRSREIIPLKQRGQPVFSELRCRCLCIYKQPPLVLNKGEEVILLDNSQRLRWRVRTLTGQEELVPSVCILIPPPNYEAIEFADRLKIQLDHLQSLLRMRRRKLRQNMVLGTIDLIKGWDLAQFQALDPARREALLRALNDEATKLVAEVGEGDREMRQLRERLNDCNQHFHSLTAAANENELRRSRGPDKEFVQKLDSVSYQLSSLDQDLQNRVQQPLPHDKLSMAAANKQQADWERALQNQEGPVEQLRVTHRQLGASSPQVDAKISFIDDKWDQMITVGNAFAERLKLLDTTLTKLDKLRGFIADQEVALGSQEGMTSDPKKLKAQKTELQTMQKALEQRQSMLDSLKEDASNLRDLVQQGRPGTTRHHDMDELDRKVDSVDTRWTKVKEQVEERLQSLNEGLDSLTQYTNGYANEQEFVAEMQEKISSAPPLSNNVEAVKSEMQSAMGIYNSLGEHQHQIENVNRHGGQFIREAKIYEKKLQQYQDNLHSVDAGLAEGLHKRARKATGAEAIKTDLDALNRQFIDQVLWANRRLQEIKDIFTEANIDVHFPVLVTDKVPLLRTFRAELTKRSSMLVDEDMQEYFQQLADFEGYGGLQAMGRTGQTFGSQTTINVTRQEGARLEMPLQGRTVAVSAAVSTPVKWRMKTPPVSSDRISQKIASITSLSGVDSEDEIVMSIPPTGQTLITVKQGCLAPQGTQLSAPAVLNPITGRKITLVDSIKARIFDPKSGSLLDPRTNRKMTISQALTNRYISNDLHKQLTSPCGITDPFSGRDCTLLEAMQRELFDPVTNKVKDPSSGKFVSLSEAVSRGIISEQCATDLSGEGVTVTHITQSQAVFLEKDLSANTVRIGLGEAIESGLYIPETGKIINPSTGSPMTVIEAVEKGLLDSTKREIKDPHSGKIMSLLEAVTNGIIDPESGKFLNKSNGQKLSLDDAYQRKLINKPTALPKALNEGVLLDNGRVIDPQTGRVISFKEALDTCVIDSESKCIVDTHTGDVLSISEAIGKGLLDDQGLVQPDAKPSGESFVEAVDAGHIKLVHEDLSFAKPCVKDTKSGRMLTVHQAMKKGIITSNGDFVDSASGRRILLKAAAGQNFIDRDVAETLSKDLSIKDASGRNISLLKAIQIGLVSPDQIEIRDPKSRKAVSLQQATVKGIISTDDAQTVLEVLSAAVTNTTVTTRLQPGQKEAGIRSISVSDASARGLLNEKTGTFRDPNTGATMPVQTAVEQGLLRLSSEWPSEKFVQDTDTVDSTMKSPKGDVGNIMKEIAENPELSESLRNTGMATLQSKLTKQTGNKNYSFTQTVVTKPKVTEHVVSETKVFQIKSIVDPRTKREISVSEAIHRGLWNMKEGVFIHPVTEEKISLTDALSRDFVRGFESSEPGPGTSPIKEVVTFSITGVIHPKTGQKVSASQAVKEGILELENGIYNGKDSLGRPLKLKISEAVEKGYVLADDSRESTSSAHGLKHETKTFQLKSVLDPVTGKRLDVADAIKKGLIDEHKGVYFNRRTGEKLTIPEAIERKLIDAELMSVSSNAEGEGSKIITTKLTTLVVNYVVDPRTGDLISVTKALEDGILDGSMEKYHNIVTGETMSLNEAIDRKLAIAQSAALNGSKSASTESIHINPDEEISESNLIEEVTSETVTFSINSVIDPRTMEMMSYDEAVLYGVLDVSRGLYVNPMTRESMPINVALEKGLIHGEVTYKHKEKDLMHSSVEASHLSFPVKKITSVVDPRDGHEISLDKALKDGIIDLEKGTYFDSAELENISLERAHAKGFIKLSKTTDERDIERMRMESERRDSERERRHKSAENGIDSQVEMKMEKFGVSGDQSESVFADEVLNYRTDVEDKAEKKGPLEIHEQRGVRTWRQQEMAVVDTQPETSESSRSESPQELEYFELSDGMSFQSALKLGLFDVKSGKVRDPKTGKFVPLSDAIERDILDKNKPAMKDILTGRELTLKQCIDKGIIDSVTGKINDKKAKAEKVTFSPDINLKQTKGKPLNLLDCVGSGLYDPDTGMISDPRSHRSYTLKEALSQNIVDGNLVTVLDEESGERVPLVSALRQGLIDGVTCEVTNPATGVKSTLLQAIQQGLVENVFDKDSGTLYDTLTGKAVPIDKALTEGQLRSDEAKIVDTTTGEAVPLDLALRKGLVDIKTGAVTDKATGKKMSPQEAIKLGLLAVVGAPVLAGKAVYDAIKERTEKVETVDVQPVKSSPKEIRESPVKPKSPSSPVSRVNGEAAQNGHLPFTENYTEHLEQPRTTIVYAKPGDRIKPTPPRQLFFGEETKEEEYKPTERFAGQLADSYDKLVQDLHNELNWLSDIEQLLKDDQPVSEEAYKAQSQREALSALHDDVLKHQQPIRSLVYQSEQLVEHHQEELTPEQVTELQNLESGIKTSFGKVQKTCEARMKHLTAATEELTKFEAELQKFTKWLEDTERELDRQTEAAQEFESIRRVTEQHKEMTAEIVNHGADLRFLSFAVTKYMEEAKLHKLELDAYKADRVKPSRLSRTSWIAMDNKEVEVVKEKQKDAESRYKDLKSRCSGFGEKLSQLAAKQKEFNDGTWAMLSWLTDAEEKLSMTRQDPSSPEPDSLRDHLEKMKALGNDAIVHKNQMMELEKSGKDIIAQMRELGIGGDQTEKIEEIISDISGRHEVLSAEIAEKANDLQTAVTKSQDVQDAAEQLLTWLKETDRKLDLQTPLSLNQEKLNDQMQQLNIIEKDIESHKPSIDSVKQAARELMKTCDLDMAKAMEEKVGDINAKFVAAQKKCRAATREASDVSDKLTKFSDKLDTLKTWLQSNTDSLESSDLSKRPIDQLKLKVEDTKMEKHRQLQEMETIQALGRELVEDPRTSDPTAVKMALANLEQSWTKFDECLSERDSEANLKESKEHEYEAIKQEVVRWLTQMESDVDAFEPVAVDMDVVAKQIEELQPMIQEYYEFSPKIDELTEVGNAYEFMQSGETRPKSPMRFRNRRIGSSLMSPRLRSPSPTTGSFPFGSLGGDITSPMSMSSDSSGVGSRKSSSDFLQLDGASSGVVV